MHHAVHVSRSSCHTSLDKAGTLSMNPLSKIISDDICGSDVSIYAEHSAYLNDRSSVLCRCMALCDTRGWGCDDLIDDDLHGCAFE